VTGTPSILFTSQISTNVCLENLKAGECLGHLNICLKMVSVLSHRGVGCQGVSWIEVVRGVVE
jgi:hypothetical protein